VSEADKQLEIATQAGLTALIINAIFFGVSKFKGDHWRLSQDELLELSHTTALAINSALPDSYLEVYDATLKRYAPVIAAVSSAATIIGKRIVYERTLAAQGAGVRAGAQHGGGDVRQQPKPFSVVSGQSDDRGQAATGTGGA
jgi:hypothetical protein